MSSHISDDMKFDACYLQIAVTGCFAILAQPVKTKHMGDVHKVTAECVHCTEVICPLSLPEEATNNNMYLDLQDKL
jgi:hypothetical protein